MSQTEHLLDFCLNNITLLRNLGNIHAVHHTESVLLLLNAGILLLGDEQSSLYHNNNKPI